jgi:hypothetical protein
MKYWEDLGYKFSAIWDDFECFNVSVPGSITIDTASQEIMPGAGGSTHYIYDDITMRIHLADIEVLLKKDRVLEHELGHALGWSHTKSKGHIMNSQLNLGGWNSDGLKKINLIIEKN